MNCKRTWSMACCTLALALAPWVATAEVHDDRWSIWPLGGVIFSDDADFDIGWAAGLKATRPLSDHIVLEIGGDYSVLETDTAGDYERPTVRAGVQLFPGRPFYDTTSSFQPYLGLGGHYSRVDFLGQTTGAFGPYGSLGFLQRVGESAMLLFEARYQIDSTQEKGPLPESDFYTWQGLLGLRIPLGEKPIDRTRDADGDGVPDYLDQCPGTPKGVAVGPNGCPLDADGDGVADYIDQCADTPPGVAVGADGCPLPPQVKCPDTPAGIPVGADNCPLDSDGDGIPDYLDECPKTPPGMKILPNGCALKGDCRRPRPGEQVDANGCAIEQSFVLRGVKFEFDSDRLTHAAREILNGVAETLKAYPNIAVELEGHTDNVGTDAYNLGLSERRATSVKRYLIDHGIAAERMKPIGYGESQPIAGNDTEEGREENRRVELQVIE